ncbi:hypothetical protein IC801_17250 [Geobacillus sp. 44B]|nr:hypothetical protein IC801_17250 [Geobacillus sp. 44B]
MHHYRLSSTKSSQIVGTLCILSSILLYMSFPITFSTGFNFDLRQIPLILGSLYGGYRLDIWLYLGILAYRYLLYDTRTNSSIRNALLLHKRKGNRIRYDGCV